MSPRVVSNILTSRLSNHRPGVSVAKAIAHTGYLLAVFKSDPELFDLADLLIVAFAGSKKCKSLVGNNVVIDN